MKVTAMFSACFLQGIVFPSLPEILKAQSLPFSLIYGKIVYPFIYPKFTKMMGLENPFCMIDHHDNGTLCLQHEPFLLWKNFHLLGDFSSSFLNLGIHPISLSYWISYWFKDIWRDDIIHVSPYTFFPLGGRSSFMAFRKNRIKATGRNEEQSSRLHTLHGTKANPCRRSTMNVACRDKYTLILPYTWRRSIILSASQGIMSILAQYKQTWLGQLHSSSFVMLENRTRSSFLVDTKLITYKYCLATFPGFLSSHCQLWQKYQASKPKAYYLKFQSVMTQILFFSIQQASLYNTKSLKVLQTGIEEHDIR